MHLSDSLMGDNETESNSEISGKVSSGVYKLSRNSSKKNRSYVWDIFHLIILEDDTVLQSRLFCTRCNKVLTSRGLSTSNLRRHRCFLKYLDEIGVSDASNLTYVDDETIIKRERLSGGSGRGSVDKNERIRNSLNSADSLNDSTVNTKMELHLDDTELHPYCDDADDTNFDLEDGEDSILSTEHSTSAIKRRRTTKGDDEVSQTSRVDATCSSSSTSKIDPLRANGNDTLPAKLHQSNTTILEREDEADIFAKAWAQAYRKLNEEQQFYAKRGIDELLVLGRLERLTLNTVTVLGNK